MSWNPRRNYRKLHRWGAILSALPFLIVLISGLFLQVKKEFAWIQPPTHQGSISNQSPEISFPEILAVARAAPQAEITGWEDIDRLDVRPDDGIVKVRSRNDWELQIDLGSGELLHFQQRRSDVIESIHDGSWFHDKAKLRIFLPSAIIITILWLTGIYLFFLPYVARRKNRRRRARRNRRRHTKSDTHNQQEPQLKEQ
ncbi:MAG: PepSY-associated TM helix domain-containing protein [Balneolaceae bacterium]|nr:PepSY-associated TM helix domain-containing protein [Balneolaceae bacterium]